MLKKLLIITLILISGLSPALVAGAAVTDKTQSQLSVTATTDWPMAGANPGADFAEHRRCQPRRFSPGVVDGHRAAHSQQDTGYCG